MQSTHHNEVTPRTAAGLNYLSEKIATITSQNVESSNISRTKKFDLKDQILLLDKQRTQPTHKFDKMADQWRQA